MADGVAQAFTAARERAAAAARAGGANAGVEAARVLSGEVDAIIIDVAGREVAQCKTPVAIFATGGFGRGEAFGADWDYLAIVDENDPGRKKFFGKVLQRLEACAGAVQCDRFKPAHVQSPANSGLPLATKAS